MNVQVCRYFPQCRLNCNKYMYTKVDCWSVCMQLNRMVECQAYILIAEVGHFTMILMLKFVGQCTVVISPLNCRSMYIANFTTKFLLKVHWKCCFHFGVTSCILCKLN